MKYEAAITVNSENDRTTAKYNHSFLSELFRELMLFTLSQRLPLPHIYAKICAYDEISYTIDRKEYSLSMATSWSQLFTPVNLKSVRAILFRCWIKEMAKHIGKLSDLFRSYVQSVLL